jgi:hypothetical protein
VAVLRRKDDPVLVDRQTGDENREVKIDARQTREAQGNSQQLQCFHNGEMLARSGVFAKADLTAKGAKDAKGFGKVSGS